MKQRSYRFPKDQRKVLRGTIQAIILAILAFLIFRAFFSFEKYKPYQGAPAPIDHGFITVSYLGADRTQNDGRINQKLLDAHLKSLYDSGYVTITQDDIIDYYAGKKNLPEKSLFLIFEDGKRNTSVFSQDLLEKYNFIATMFSYANTVNNGDTHFLTASELIKLQKSSYWEMGTNGYRLHFINVFDRYGKYLGALNPLQFSMVSPYLEREYDHYLMDYQRDENGLPTETYEQLKARFEKDYMLLEQTYSAALGKTPQAYSLMHANTGQFGTNDRASRINEENIRNLFAMNINREGFAHNDRTNQIYDLTRIQPQPSWSVNHLLTRIHADTEQDVSYVVGDSDRAASWTLLSGQAQYDEQTIILTSPPAASSKLLLNHNSSFFDGSVSVTLLGNALGSQSIILRANKEQTAYIKAELKDQQLYIIETQNGQQTTLLQKSLNEIKNISPQSISENKRQTQISELEMRIRYSSDVGEIERATKELFALRNQNIIPATENDAYIPHLSLNERQKVQLDIKLSQNQVSVSVDGIVAGSNIAVQKSTSGAVLLESSPSDQGYSQRNLKDDVYDGVFENLVVSDPEEQIVFDARLHGKDAFVAEIHRNWNTLVSWFVNQF